MRVDGDVEHPGRDPDDQHQQRQDPEGPGEGRQGGRRPEENQSDRHEPGTEQVGQPSGRKHGGKRSEGDAEQSDADLRLARARLLLDRGQTGGPAAPEQPEDRERRRQPTSALHVALSERPGSDPGSDPAGV